MGIHVIDPDLFIADGRNEFAYETGSTVAPPSPNGHYSDQNEASEGRKIRLCRMSATR